MSELREEVREIEEELKDEERTVEQLIEGVKDRLFRISVRLVELEERIG